MFLNPEILGDDQEDWKKHHNIILPSFKKMEGNVLLNMAK